MASFQMAYDTLKSDYTHYSYYESIDIEDAAWHAKNFCDHYGHKLVNVKYLGDKYDT